MNHNLWFNDVDIGNNNVFNGDFLNINVDNDKAKLNNEVDNFFENVHNNPEINYDVNNFI